LKWERDTCWILIPAVSGVVVLAVGSGAEGVLAGEMGARTRLALAGGSLFLDVRGVSFCEG
jgi:hypothetical protein